MAILTSNQSYQSTYDNIYVPGDSSIGTGLQLGAGWLSTDISPHLIWSDPHVYSFMEGIGKYELDVSKVRSAKDMLHLMIITRSRDFWKEIELDINITLKSNRKMVNRLMKRGILTEIIIEKNV